MNKSKERYADYLMLPILIAAFSIRVEFSNDGETMSGPTIRIYKISHH